MNRFFIGVFLLAPTLIGCWAQPGLKGASIKSEVISGSIESGTGSGSGSALGSGNGSPPWPVIEGFANLEELIDFDAENTNNPGECSEEQIQAYPFSGSGTPEDPYRICSETQFDRVRNYTSSHFILALNLDLGSQQFVPIPNFKGSFDGNGKMITGVMVHTPQNDHVGMFAKLSGATVKNLLLDGVDVRGRNFVGGLAGRIAHGSLISRVFVTGSVAGEARVAGIAGQVLYSKIEGSRADVIRVSLNGDEWLGEATQLGECTKYCGTLAVPVEEQPKTPSLCSSPTPFDGGSGTRKDPFLISSAQQLQNLHCNPSASFRLKSDISLSGVSYDPVENYSGHFDGAGFSIYNLSLNLPTKFKVGLFNSVVGGIVKDLAVESAQVKGSYGVSAVAGSVESGGVILRCRSSGAVNIVYGERVMQLAGGGGGVVGYSHSAMIAESSSSVTVVAVQNSGGLLGHAEAATDIMDSYATGDIYCTATCGRLAGVLRSGSSITTSHAVSPAGGNLVSSIDGPVTSSALNPSTSDISGWDPAIWDTREMYYPSHRNDPLKKMRMWRPDSAICNVGYQIQNGFQCRLSNNNLFIKYYGNSKGRIDAKIRVSNTDGIKMSNPSEQTVTLSGGEIQVGMSQKNCSPIISNGRFAGWYCPEPSAADRLFEGRSNSPLYVEVTFITPECAGDTRYCDNSGFFWRAYGY